MPERLNLILQAYRTYLPITSFSVITTGSLAVSVTDMTAPVVGSSGGVYALVSAHLANVVMVSLYVYAHVHADDYHITQPSCHYRTLPHHQSSLFWGPAGAALSVDATHSSPSPSVFPSPKDRKVCAHVYVTACEEISSRCTLTSASALLGLNVPSTDTRSRRHSGEPLLRVIGYSSCTQSDPPQHSRGQS